MGHGIAGRIRFDEIVSLTDENSSVSDKSSATWITVCCNEATFELVVKLVNALSIFRLVTRCRSEEYATIRQRRIVPRLRVVFSFNR